MNHRSQPIQMTISPPLITRCTTSVSNEIFGWSIGMGQFVEGWLKARNINKFED